MAAAWEILFDPSFLSVIVICSFFLRSPLEEAGDVVVKVHLLWLLVVDGWSEMAIMLLFVCR